MNQKTGPCAILFANGTTTASELTGLRPSAFDRIIAADGGSRVAMEMGYLPDTVVGDLDSVTDDIREQLRDTRWLHRPSQESCDLEKALVVCRDDGIRELTVVGFTGRRLDHTLGNLSVLARYRDVFDFRLITPHGTVFLVDERLELAAASGQTISLVPLLPVTRVTTTGLKYPLTGEPLAVGLREGTSNEAVDGPVTITIDCGLLAIFLLD